MTLSKTNKFKNEFVNFIRMLYNCDIRYTPYPIAYTEIHEKLKGLVLSSKLFEDPFTEYFKYYSHPISFAGNKKSIAEGVIIAYLYAEIVLQGKRITTQIEKEIYQLADEYCASVDKWSIYYGIVELC